MFPALLYEKNSWVLTLRGNRSNWFSKGLGPAIGGTWRSPQRRAGEAPSGKSRAGDKAQQRAKACDRGGAGKMQPANARFKCPVKDRQAAVPNDLGAHVRRQQVHLVDIDAVAGRQQYVVETLGGVVERQRNAFAILARG